MKEEKRKKIIKNLIIFLLILLAYLPILVYADNVTLTNPSKYQTVKNFLEAVRNFIWVLVAPLSAIMLIWAGIVFVSSGGDPDKVRKAKMIIMYVIVGIFVALLATGIVEIIKNL